MDSEPFQVESCSSVNSLVDRCLGLITPNTELLGIMFFGVIKGKRLLIAVECSQIGTMFEVAGYWPSLHMQDLLPDQSEELEVEEVSQLQADLKKVIYATPFLQEKQKVLLVPWLLCSLLRSILLRLLQSLAGLVLCAAQDTLTYSCVQYSTINGAKLCISLFIWTNVHNFYHYLDKKKSNHEFERVIKTIHKAGMRKMMSDSIGSPDSSNIILPLEGLDEDELPGTEATLVERAAMAWIAREILEDDDEYVSDSQFSHYLALKATMELRHIIRELSEKRKENNKSSMRERINDSLEFCKTTSKYYESKSETCIPRMEAFDESKGLSRRDPLRKIPPLVIRGRPYFDDEESLAGEDIEVFQDIFDAETSTVLENSVQVQTDPLSSQMNLLFDLLDQQHMK